MFRRWNWADVNSGSFKIRTVLQLLQVTVYKQLGAYEVTVRG